MWLIGVKIVKKQYSLDYENYKTKVLTGDNICYHQFIKKKIIKPNIINA